MGFQRQGGGLLILKSTRSKTQYKILNKSCKIWKKLKTCNFDFFTCDERLTYMNFESIISTENDVMSYI